jgi:hypothetical protein
MSTSHIWSSASVLDPASMPHAQFAFEIAGVYGGAMLFAACLPFAYPMAKFVFSGRR